VPAPSGRKIRIAAIRSSKILQDARPAGMRKLSCGMARSGQWQLRAEAANEGLATSGGKDLLCRESASRSEPFSGFGSGFGSAFGLPLTGEQNRSRGAFIHLSTLRMLFLQRRASDWMRKGRCNTLK